MNHGSIDVGNQRIAWTSRKGGNGKSRYTTAADAVVPASAAKKVRSLISEEF
jgi:MinD-like ATPase involved in chromosome partitioning or flagellar assembly